MSKKNTKLFQMVETVRKEVERSDVAKSGASEQGELW